MREIKFRAWDKNRKKMWSHSDLYKMDCSNEYPFLALIRGFYATNMFPGEEMDVIPMQFTGLYDKNGKEIYEGDIVSYFGLKYEVLFKNGAFGWMEDGAFYSFNEMDRSEVNKFEIIGNIYENPELLEESK